MKVNQASMNNYPQKTLTTLDFLDVESSTFNQEDKIDKIEDVSSSLVSSSCYTNKNVLYSIPSELHKFEKNQEIKKMVSGNEHSLILLHSGDVYGWGCGL